MARLTVSICCGTHCSAVPGWKGQLSRMTLIDDIVHLLRLRPDGLSDAELAQATGKRHQQINQRCRALTEQGVLAREPINGVIRNRLAAGAAVVGGTPAIATGPDSPPIDRDWFWEGNVQAALCAWLVAEGWVPVQVMNTATKQQGTDVVATRDGVQLHVEVKGYPSVGYADPRRAGEVKHTQPGLQAKHWYADALLKVVRLRGRHPHDEVAMAFPDMPRYRTLLAETAQSLHVLRIEVFLVSETGSVSVPTRESC